ncbi:MAG: hypothetical protein ACQEVA_14870 [Myxococcota bacterium]
MSRSLHILFCLIAAALLTGCPVDGYVPADEDADPGQDADAMSDDVFDQDTADAGGDSADDTTDGDADDTGDGEGADAGDATDDGDAGSSTCVPERDGKITRDEVILEAGLSAKFETATDVTVDTAGEEQSDGTHVWDLTGPYNGDKTTLVTLMSLDGKWYKPEFPDATYASQLADGEDEVGVFRATDTALYLQGIVTPNESTELHYDPPAKLLDFPLEVGASWTTDATVSGTYLWNPWTSVSEDYQSQVDARGTLKTPYGELPVVRIQTVLDRTVGFSTTTVRTFSFVSECFGTVATITSKDNEDQVEFTEASSVRRLSR